MVRAPDSLYVPLVEAGHQLGTDILVHVSDDNLTPLLNETRCDSKTDAYAQVNTVS